MANRIDISNCMNSKIVIKNEIIAQYAGYAAMECPGVLGMAMASPKDGLYKLLKKESSRKGVSIRDTERGLIVDLHMIVVYENNLQTIAENVVKSVTDTIQRNTKMHVYKVYVHIEGVKSTN